MKLKGIRGQSRSQEEWRAVFESRYSSFEFIYNDGGIEGYNYIRCKYCGDTFRNTAQNMKPSHKQIIICRNCEKLNREYERKHPKKSEAYIKYLQACMFPKGKRGKQLTMRECIICRQFFVPTHGRQKYCSTSCATYMDWKGKEAYRYKIDLGILYRRDGGICHICGKLCDWNDFTIMEDGSLKVGANYPTRDHLIPKSKGGEHSYENIKLAHHRCNSLRGASGT